MTAPHPVARTTLHPTPRLRIPSRTPGGRRGGAAPPGRGDCGAARAPSPRCPARREDALSAGRAEAEPPPPPAPRRAGPSPSARGAVIVPERYPSAPPPQSPSASPGPSEAGAAEGSHARAHVPPWPREGARLGEDQPPPPAPPLLSLPAPGSRPRGAGGRAPGRALLARSLAAVPATSHRRSRGGGRSVPAQSRLLPAPAPPPLPPRPPPPPPLRLLLLAVPAAVRRARRWPVGRATWIT